MSSFYKVLLEQDLDNYCNEFYRTINQPISDVVLTEAFLSTDQVMDIFTKAEEYRGGEGSKTSAAYKNKIKPKLTDLANKAKDSQIARAVAAGGDRARQAVDLIDNKVDIGLQDLKSKLQGIEGGEKVIQAAQKAGQLAKDNPKSASFVLGALTAAATMATGGAAGPAIGMLLRGSLELAKGETFSTAVKRGATTAAIGGVIGAGMDGISSQVSDLIADGTVPEVEVSNPEINGETAQVQGAISTSTHGTLAEFDLVLTDQDQLDELRDIMSGNDPLDKVERLEAFTAEIENSTDQDQLHREHEQYNSDREARSDAVDARSDAVEPGVQGAGAAAAGAATSRHDNRTRTNSSLDYEEILKYNSKLNEGPLGSLARGAARGTGRLAGKAAKATGKAAARGAGKAGKAALSGLVKGSGALGQELAALAPGGEPISAEELAQKWKQEYDSSTDSDDIAALLSSNGFSKMQIKKILKNADATDIDPKVTKLADKIKELGIDQQLLKWITRNEKKLRSVLPEGIITEQKISDKQIKDIFQKISKLPREQKADDEEAEEKAPGYTEPDIPEPTNDNPIQSRQESIQVWADMINETSRVERIMLVNRAINRLSDHYGINKWPYVHKKVVEAVGTKAGRIETLNDGRVMDKELFLICKSLVEACDLTWGDFLTRPVKVAGYIKFKPMVYQRRALHEETVGRKRK